MASGISIILDDNERIAIHPDNKTPEELFSWAMNFGAPPDSAAQIILNDKYGTPEDRGDAKEIYDAVIAGLPNAIENMDGNVSILVILTAAAEINELRAVVKQLCEAVLWLATNKYQF